MQARAAPRTQPCTTSGLPLLHAETSDICTHFATTKRFPPEPAMVRKPHVGIARVHACTESRRPAVPPRMGQPLVLFTARGKRREQLKKCSRTEQQETAGPKSAKQESGSDTRFFVFFFFFFSPLRPPRQGRNCCKRSTGCYQPRAGAAVCSLSQPSCNRRLFFDKQDASISADSFPVTWGRGAAPLCPLGERAQVHPGRA